MAQTIIQDSISKICCMRCNVDLGGPFPEVAGPATYLCKKCNKRFMNWHGRRSVKSRKKRLP